MAKKVRDVIKALEGTGWTLVRQTGGHRHYRHPDRSVIVTVSGKPNVEVPAGTLANIRRTSGLDDLR